MYHTLAAKVLQPVEPLLYCHFSTPYPTSRLSQKAAQILKRCGKSSSLDYKKLESFGLSFFVVDVRRGVI